MKRVTPSFTVEYRQAKRPSTGSAKPGWANVRPAPIGRDEKTNRTAISAFKTVAAQPTAEVISPSILPAAFFRASLRARLWPDRPTPETPNRGVVGGAAQAGDATLVPAAGTAARQLGEHVYPAEGLEPPIALAAIPPLEQPTTSRLSAGKAATRRSEKRSRRSAERQEKLDNAPRTSADRFETAPMSSTLGLPPVDKPSSTTRTSRILGRYVYRDELSAGESWKGRINARRERRA